MNLVNIFNYGIEQFVVDVLCSLSWNLNSTLTPLQLNREHYPKCDEILPSTARAVFKKLLPI